MTLQAWPGSAYPLGATFDGNGTNFAVFSEGAERVELCLFDDDGAETRVELRDVDAFVSLDSSIQYPHVSGLPRSSPHYDALALRVPNGAFYVAMRRRLDAPAPGATVARLLLAHSNLLTFPYRHGFTLESLTLLLERTGFAVERVYGDALVPIADDWTQGWAALEERAVKGALRVLAKGEAEAAPWLEVYARKI